MDAREDDVTIAKTKLRLAASRFEPLGPVRRHPFSAVTGAFVLGMMAGDSSQTHRISNAAGYTLSGLSRLLRLVSLVRAVIT